MTEGIKWNPFTQKPLTTEEIQKLDINLNGKVEENEFDAGITWLAGGIDEEGLVDIEGPQKSNENRTINSQEELSAEITKIKDGYIENYLNKNKNLKESERATIIDIVTKFANEFMQNCLNDNSQWQSETIKNAFTTGADNAIKNNKAAFDEINQEITDSKSNTDKKYDSMTQKAIEADNGYVSTAEWQEVKKLALDYIVSGILNGQIDDALLSSMNPKYANNSNYQNAIVAANKLKNCTDPIEMQTLLKEIKDSIIAFLNQMGSNKVVDAITDSHKGKEEDKIKAELTKVADTWVENQINADMTQEQITKLSEFGKNSIGKYISILDGQNALDSSNLEKIKADFNKYINEEYVNFKEVQKDIHVDEGEIEKAQENLLNITKTAANGNITTEEKAKIVEAGTELIYQQLLAGNTVIPLLKGLNPNYANTKEFKEIQSIATKINSSTDYEEIQKLEEQIKKLITALLNKYDSDKLLAGVDSTKPIEINDKTKDYAIYNSEIGNDYTAGKLRGTSRGYQDEKRLEEIQELARQDIAKYAVSLKAQLKAELGTAYDEAFIDSIIAAATNDTIALFTENIKRDTYDNSDIDKETYGFMFDRNSGSHRGRFKYNVTALIDKFTELFNEAAKTLTTERNDPTKITYDKEDVIQSSIGNEYLNPRDNKIRDNDEAQLTLKVKSKLILVAEAIKSQLIAKGCKVPIDKITELLDESIVETMAFAENKIYTTHDYDWFVFANERMFNVPLPEIVDYFMTTFDAKLEKAKGNVKEKEKEKEKDKTEEEPKA